MVISVTSCHRVTLSGTLEPRAAFLYISLEHRNFSISHWAKFTFKNVERSSKKINTNAQQNYHAVYAQESFKM